MSHPSVAPREPLRKVPVAQIELTNRATQSRVKMFDHRITEYAEAIARGEDLFEAVADPVQLFHDGTKFWIADGWHRVSAAIRLHRTHVLARVTAGGQDAAIKVAVGANATHGIQRTNEDKRRAVILALQHPELRRLSDRRLAKYIHVSHTFVQNVRREMSGNVATVATRPARQPAPRRPAVRPDPIEVKARAVIAALNSLYDTETMFDLSELAGVPLSDATRLELGELAAQLVADLGPFAIAEDPDAIEATGEAEADAAEELA